MDSITTYTQELTALNSLYAHIYDNLVLAHTRHEALLWGDSSALKVCVCIYIHTYAYLYPYTWVHACIYVLAHTRREALLCGDSSVLKVCICVYMCACMHIYDTRVLAHGF